VAIALWVHSNGVSAERAEVQEKFNTADQSLRSAESDVQQLKTWIGVPADTTVQTLEEQFAQDAALFGAGLDETQRSYRQFCQTLLASVQEKTSQLLQAQENEKKLLADMQAARQELEAARAQYNEQITQTAQTYETTREGLSARQQEDDKQKQELLKQLDDRTKQIASIQTESKRQIDTLQAELEALRTQLRRAKTELDQQLSQTFDVPDGRITGVNQRTQTVWINRGRQDGLRPNITFSVFAQGGNTLDAAVKKGSIEITQVHNGQTAEARILEDDHRNPIMSGDLIASPIWNPGTSLHFALVGKMDINGDDADDRQLVKNLIRLTNGIIDAEDTPEGEVRGQMSIHTRYLVVGDNPSEASEAEQIRTYSEMVREATRLGIEQISVHNLIDAMGFGARVRSVGDAELLEETVEDAAQGAAVSESSLAPRRGRREAW
jgi:hypothetical protein